MAKFSTKAAGNASKDTKSHKTQKAVRKSHLRRDEVLSLSEKAGVDPKPLSDYSTTFSGDSIIHLTWGKITSGPTPAISKARRYNGFRARQRRASSKGGEQKPDSLPVEKEPYPLLSNLPTELREIVYSFILISSGAIILHCDWYAVQNDARLNLSILRVCKEIGREASEFLYQKNIFHALVRAKHPSERFEQCIFPKYVPLFRNVLIECMQENWSTAWIAHTANCINILIKKDVVLHSLTLIIMPDIMPKENPITKEVKNVTTFADFFAKECKVLKALMRLKCEVFNLIIKLKGRKKIVISLDVRYLECNFENSLFANDQASMNGRSIKSKKVKTELMGLKTAVEMIAANWEEAVQLNVGRLMEEGEDITNGAAFKKI